MRDWRESVAAEYEVLDDDNGDEARGPVANEPQEVGKGVVKSMGTND